MKKLSVLAFALVMSVSVNVFADTLGADTLVDGTRHAAGSHGETLRGSHTFRNPVNVNGTTYPSGTQFHVIRLDNGALVPTHVTNAAGVTTSVSAGGAATGGVAGGAATGGAVTGGAVTGGVVAGGVSAGAVAVGAGVAGLAAAGSSNTTVTHQ